MAPHTYIIDNNKTSIRVCGCVGVWVCGCVCGCVWVCGCVMLYIDCQSDVGRFPVVREVLRASSYDPFHGTGKVATL